MDTIIEKKAVKNDTMNFFMFITFNVFNGVGGVPWGAFIAHYSIIVMFVSSMGFSNVSVGIVNALFWLGFALPQIPASYFFETLRKKRNWIIVIHSLASGSLFIYGAILTLAGNINPLILLILFFVFYQISCLIAGCGTPIFFAFFNKIVPAEKLGKSMGILFVSSTLAGMGGGYIVSKIMTVWPVKIGDPGFSLTAYKILFLTAFPIILIGVAFLFLIKERPGEKIEKKTTFMHYLIETFSILKKDNNLTRFIIGKNLMFGHYVANILYASIAVTMYDVGAANAGFFVTFFFAGNVVSGLTLAKLSDKFGPKFLLITSQLLAFSCIIGTLFAVQLNDVISPIVMAAGTGINRILQPLNIVLPISSGFQYTFYVIFFVSGLAQVCDNIGYSNMCFQSCPTEDKTTYVALTNVMVFLMPIIMPFLFNLFIKSKVLSIENVFIACAVFSLIAVCWFVFFVKNPIGFKRLKEEQ